MTAGQKQCDNGSLKGANFTNLRAATEQPSVQISEGGFTFSLAESVATQIREDGMP